jgi:hypothetical protein
MKWNPGKRVQTDLPWISLRCIQATLAETSIQGHKQEPAIGGIRSTRDRTQSLETESLPD